MKPLLLPFLAGAMSAMISGHQPAGAAVLRAGAARVEITDRTAGPVNDPLFAKALVLQHEDTTVVLITIDAVAIGEIGRIGNGFLAAVRGPLEKEFGIPPGNVLVNASHCHGIVRGDTALLALDAVREARKRLTPVRVGAGAGREDRISENRRLKMKDGSETDMRRAYSMPADAAVASVGPIDPRIGLLRFDRLDGRPLAVLYHFACHPIMGVPNGGNTADFPGFASRVIEEQLGHGTLALFVQGCGGDINPVRYKDVTRPPDAEPLGLLLGHSAVRALAGITTSEGAELRVVSETVALPRAADLERRIAAIETEQARLLRALKPTTINFKTFLPLLLQQKIWPEFPSQYSQSYLHDKSLGREDLARLDAGNRASVEAYLHNLESMEQLTRLNTNLALLRKHLAGARAAGKPTLDAEVAGLRVGDFRLITFPGELTVEIGLAIQKRAPSPLTFVAGYTNGYIYYTATEAQRNNPGYAQEDCDSVVAPEWRALFDRRVDAILKKLAPSPLQP